MSLGALLTVLLVIAPVGRFRWFAGGFGAGAIGFVPIRKVAPVLTGRP
jgi:hypothetical protein